MKEEKDKVAYKTIPLKTRIVIRLVILVLRVLQPMLKKNEMAAYFAIESYADLIEDNLEEPEETLQ